MRPRGKGTEGRCREKTFGDFKCVKVKHNEDNVLEIHSFIANI